MCPRSRRWRDARKQREQTAKVLLAATELVQPEELAEAVESAEKMLASWCHCSQCAEHPQTISIRTLIRAARQQQAAQEVIAR